MGDAGDVEAAASEFSGSRLQVPMREKRGSSNSVYIIHQDTYIIRIIIMIIIIHIFVYIRYTSVYIHI